MGNNFEQLADSRKSVNNFEKGIKITVDELNKIFSVVSLAPSCFNLQHASYIVITNEDKKENFKELVCPQYKVHTSSAVVMVLGNKESYKDTDLIYKNGWNEDTVKSIANFYESKGDSFAHDEAIRNASLSAMMFMLAAKDMGYDTCPMMGFDKEAARVFFDLPNNLEPVLLITLGIEDKSNIKVREYRKDLKELFKLY